MYVRILLSALFFFFFFVLNFLLLYTDIIVVTFIGDFLVWLGAHMYVCTNAAGVA